MAVIGVHDGASLAGKESSDAVCTQSCDTSGRRSSPSAGGSLTGKESPDILRTRSLTWLELGHSGDPTFGDWPNMIASPPCSASVLVSRLPGGRRLKGSDAGIVPIRSFVSRSGITPRSLREGGIR
jgi:hypothetical protein